MSFSREQIFAEVQRLMQDLFDIDADKVTADARLHDDLDLDSIDAVDMAASLQKFTGKRIDEARLRSIRTVGDLVTVVEQLAQ